MSCDGVARTVVEMLPEENPAFLKLTLTPDYMSIRLRVYLRVHLRVHLHIYVYLRVHLRINLRVHLRVHVYLRVNLHAQSVRVRARRTLLSLSPSLSLTAQTQA